MKATLKQREAMGREEGEEMMLPLPVKLIYRHQFVVKGKGSSRGRRIYANLQPIHVVQQQPTQNCKANILQLKISLKKDFVI